MSQYGEDAEPKAIRQYAEIIALTDDVYEIANYLEISSEIIRKVKEHLFIKEHDLDIADDKAKTISNVRCNFTPDGKIAELWLKATNSSLEPKDLTTFKRLIAHEYIEQALMADGLPYRSPQAWKNHPIAGLSNWATPEHYGAHDIAPNANPKRPTFSHWVRIGKSAEGLTLADNISNLDELLEAIRERI